MKIGILVWDLNINGGTQRQALELASKLTDQGSEVIVYTYYYDDVHCYPNLCSNLTIKFVKKKVRPTYNNKLSVLLHYMIKYSLFFFEVRQKKILKIIDTDLDLLNPHDYHIYPTAAMWKKKTSKPVVWMMNDLPLYKNNIRKSLKTVLYYIKPRFKNYIKSFDKILVLDNKNKEQLKSNLNLNSEIIRSGIDLTKFSYHYHSVNNTFTILSIGIFLPHRRIEDSIEALNILVNKNINVKLIHIGSEALDTNYSKKIRKLVKNLELDKYITFYNSISDEELLEQYKKANILLFPNAPQTWGLAVFEAMASGLPVVLTTGCGASEILTYNVHAKIVEPYRPDLIAQAVVELYHDGNLRKRLSLNGRKLVENELSWNKYSQNMLNHFRQFFYDKKMN